MVLSILAKDLLTKKFKKVDANITLNKAISLFDDDTDVLFVFDGTKFLGSVTEWDIIKSGLNRAEAKIKSIAKPTPKISKDYRATTIARLMIENDIFELIVIEDNEVIGVVTIDNLLKEVIKKSFGNIKAKEAMSPDVIVTHPKDTVFSLLNLFKQHHISRAPVVDNNELLGIIRMHDIIIKVIELKLNPEPSIINTHEVLKNIFVDSLLSYTFETASINSPLKEIVNKLFSNELIEEVIITNDGTVNTEIKGIITKKDLLELILNEESKIELIKLQISSKVNINRELVKKEFYDFLERFESILGNGFVYLYFVKINNSLMQGRIRLYTDKKRLYLKEEGKNELEVINKLIDKIKLNLK